MPSIDHLLKQTAHIQARSQQLNRLNQEVLAFVEKSPPEARVPCWVYTVNITERYGDRAMALVDQMFKLYFPPGTDIGEQDRISEVKTPDGAVMYTNLDVTGVRKVPGRDGRIQHIEVQAFAYREGVAIQFQQPTIS